LVRSPSHCSHADITKSAAEGTIRCNGAFTCFVACDDVRDVMADDELLIRWRCSSFQLLVATSPARAQSSSSTGSSSGSSTDDDNTPASGVVASTVTYSGRYPINWALIPSSSSSLSIPSDTDVGPCICDLTWNSCDVQCLCDDDCDDTQKKQFNGPLLAEGPVSNKILTCLDPNLVSINARGALTVSLIDNMLCVSQDNSQTHIYAMYST
jgi:hypothetical protein